GASRVACTGGAGRGERRGEGAAKERRWRREPTDATPPGMGARGRRGVSAAGFEPRLPCSSASPNVPAMLHFLRRHSQSKVIQVIFLAIIAVFVLWGVGGIVNSQNRSTPVAAVDGHRIEATDVQRAYRNLQAAYRDAYKDRFSPELEKTLGLRQRALDGLIERQLLANRAGVLGLTVSDQEL